MAVMEGNPTAHLGLQSAQGGDGRNNPVPGADPQNLGGLKFWHFRGYFRVIRAHGPYLSDGNTQKYHMVIFLPKTTATWCAEANGEY